VLLVFGLLVIPAVAGVIASPRPGVALLVGWVFGFFASVLGLVASVSLDLPAAPTILVTLTTLLVIMGSVFGLVHRNRPRA
jgi:ABC-type Mn2+/Zn2+ transport system permease subunit